MMKTLNRIFICFALVLAPAAALYPLPYIPGCPLHDSCVRALKQEQRNRQRAIEQRETPDGEDSGAEFLGFYFGFQAGLGDLNDKTQDYINLRPSLGYMNSFGGWDVFFCAFYTAGLDNPAGGAALPPLHRGGIEASAAYNIGLPADLTLTLALDNQNQFNFTPDDGPLGVNTAFLAFAALEPAARLTYALPFGDLSAANSFPFSYADDKALDYSLSFGLNTDFGLALSASFEWWNLWVDAGSDYGKTNPPAQYGQTGLIASFWRGAFFASLALTADATFTSFSLEPYAAFTIGRTTLFASVLFDNLGPPLDGAEQRLLLIQGKRNVTGIIPSVGVKVRF
jgi:hypothetical protein